MKIAALYSSLTMPQRLRAMVSAFGRADQPECEKLAATSPDGNYTVRRVDAHFQRLSHLAALHNSFLLEPCLTWIFAQVFSPEEIRSLSPAEQEGRETILKKSLTEAASMDAAFTARITEAGITAPDWQAFRERLLDDSSKFLLGEFLRKAAGWDNPAFTAQISESIEGYLFPDAA